MNGIIIILLIIGVVLFWKWLERAAKKDALKKLQDFYIDEQYIASDNKGAIALDNKREKICIIDHLSKPHYYKFEDIYSVELIQAAEGKIKGSSAGALIGGAIAGGKGATAGYMAGFKKVVKVKWVQLKIGVNNDKTPYHSITFLNTPVKSDSFIYKDAYKKASYWKDKMDVCIERGKRTQSQPKVDFEGSIIDELMKFHDLKEKGILTEEEFEQQKAKLLNK